MRQTLFYLPHELLGIPVLGFGWVLGVLIMVAVGFLLTASKTQTIAKLLEEQGVVWLVAAGVVAFLLPQIETRIPDGTASGWIVGLPVRGYGVMLMLGVLSAVSIALYRCKQVGVSQEAFFSLATWVVVAGLVGARLFYVVQKWNELDGDNIAAKLWTSLKVTEGGLVVYGGVIGGLIAIVLWARKHRLPLLPIADSVTPAFFIGLAFGRIGCLLNGCCYGGICEQSLPAIEFPSGSPAYVDQLRSGKLLGMVTDKEPSATDPQPIRRVLPNSWASANNVVPGEKIAFVAEKQVDGMTPSEPYAHPVFEATVGIDGRRIDVASIDVPRNSLPVHPSQIYAAVSGLLLCCWTLLLAENVKKTGFVFGMGLIWYGVLRNMEEWIRVDEAGQFGTSLSIAQWISLAAILLGVAIVVRVQRHRSGPVPAV